MTWTAQVAEPFESTPIGGRGCGAPAEVAHACEYARPRRPSPGKVPRKHPQDALRIQAPTRQTRWPTAAPSRAGALQLPMIQVIPSGPERRGRTNTDELSGRATLRVLEPAQDSLNHRRSDGSSTGARGE
jgi:hypothetical protein